MITPNNQHGGLDASPSRAFMNGKPVIKVDAKTIINFDSPFGEKLLCDGPTFSTGSACVFRCAYCYVENLMRFNPHRLDKGLKHPDIVVRRTNPVEKVRQQLVNAKGRPKYQGAEQEGRVIYASPLVDVAANMELVRETIEVVREILRLTPWVVRLLSKSNLLPKVAEAFSDPAVKNRIIYGVSTGTPDDELAKAIEQGTPLVSKRIASLHWLQDHGFRTFGMICPSLPMPTADDYCRFAQECAWLLRADRMEHVWAEVINVRGKAFAQTESSLRKAGFLAEADCLRVVSAGPGSEAAWEKYARDTFEAHSKVYAGHPGKLRFLQYVNDVTQPWWAEHREQGAILLRGH